MHRTVCFEQLYHWPLLPKYMGFYLIDGRDDLCSFHKPLEVGFQKICHADCPEFSLLVGCFLTS